MGKGGRRLLIQKPPPAPTRKQIQENADSLRIGNFPVKGKGKMKYAKGLSFRKKKAPFLLSQRKTVREHIGHIESAVFFVCGERNEINRTNRNSELNNLLHYQPMDHRAADRLRSSRGKPLQQTLNAVFRGNAPGAGAAERLAESAKGSETILQRLQDAADGIGMLAEGILIKANGGA